MIQFPSSEIISEAQLEANDFNASPGDLQGYDCERCKNKGYVAVIEDGVAKIAVCRCQKLRRCIRLFNQSGINPEYTLNNFKAVEPWQKDLLDTAHRFLENPTSWVYMGGQVGCGKSHICTGIVRELLRRGIPARYMLWRDEAVKLKACVNDTEEYMALIEPLKNIDVLYIDDFFKAGSVPTNADVNLAFEIINARYNKKLVTLISSEYFIDELSNQVDEAVGSRIFERARGFIKNIGRVPERNYRLKDISRI